MDTGCAEGRRVRGKMGFVCEEHTQNEYHIIGLSDGKWNNRMVIDRYVVTQPLVVVRLKSLYYLC